MTLAKLRALDAHIRESNLDLPEQFESWMEDGTIKSRMTKLGADQYSIGRLEYDALFSFENFTGNSSELIALVSVWLYENDETRFSEKLPDADIDVDVREDGRADVDIKIRFQESIDVVKDDNGSISMLGETWRIDSPVVFDVDTVSVGDDESKPTDLEYTRPVE